MNPIGEEAGQTARSLIDALKQQPAVLALTIANFALLAFMYYGLHGAAKSREAIIERVLQNSNVIHEMVRQRSVACPPAGQQGQ